MTPETRTHEASPPARPVDPPAAPPAPTAPGPATPTPPPGAQVVLGKRYAPAEVAELSRLFNDWVMGLFTVAPFDLPFLPYSKALRAREVR